MSVKFNFFIFYFIFVKAAFTIATLIQQMQSVATVSAMRHNQNRKFAIKVAVAR